MPVEVPNQIALQRLGNSSPKQQAIGAMVLIAFYYLLQVGEYTYHRPSEKFRIQQFRVCNITFWCNTTKLDINSDQTWLMQHATAATLNISNQKNGIRAQTIHQEAINSHLCPVKALIRRVKHILEHTNDKTTMISTYFVKGQGKKSLTGRDMNKAIRDAVDSLKLYKHGLSRRVVSSHSLRSGGAMALHLNGISDNTIKKLGRWSSDTFLMYIHEQIAAFSSGISQQMSKNIEFQNIGFQPMVTTPNLIAPAV